MNLRSGYRRAPSLLELAPALLFFIQCSLLMLPDLAQGQATRVYARELHNGWTFRQAGSPEAWQPALVPGCVHTDLLANGRIEDPYYRTNERRQQWIDKFDWEYRTRFEADDSLLQKQNIALHFEGLDTYAEVFVNDVLVLKSDNMFRQWTADIKAALRPGDNELYILLRSPIQKGVMALKELGYPLPASNDQSENGGMGDKRVSVFTRKAGYHYGWDWGPRFVTSGIWRPVKLLAWNDARIQDVHIRQQSLTQWRAELVAAITVQCATAGRYTLSAQVEEAGVAATREVELAAGMHTIELPLAIKDPRRWWSRGLGEAYLYHVSASLSGQSALDGRRTAIGLRTLRVVRERDSLGASFYIELNGVPVFMKGANYIPNDLFLPRISQAEYDRVLATATDANMNMLRVWGGGVYEDDYFYDRCDELGLLVWQDFMFACSMYPGDAAFLENVRQEAIQNVQRLRNHPSIALWCGNNEIDVAWAEYDEKRGWGWKQQYNPAQRAAIWKAYDTLFHELLPEVVKQHDPSRFYWPSSPMADYGELAGNNTQKGDIHYWDVWQGRHQLDGFRKYIGRFMSEYGFQSFPELRTVKAYTVPADWDIESEVMAAHQRSGTGNLRIREYMNFYYRVPKDFEPFLYVGQVLQAEAIRIAIEAHRRRMPLNMGSLYWQLNDCWPVASWSSTDYYRRWKALHYFVRKAFAEVLISPDLADDQQLRIYGVSDRLKPVSGELQLRLLNFDGSERWSHTQAMTLAPNTSQVYFERPQAEILAGADTASVVLHAAFVADGQTLAENLYYFALPKNLRLPAARPQLTIAEADDGFWLSIRAGQLLKHLYLSADAEEEVFFSDNYFDLLPNQSVRIHCRTQLSRSAFEAALRVASLVETF